MKCPETALYDPVRKFLTKLGYTVDGEVKNCDIAAVKDGELIIVELKTSFNMTLLYQAIDRQSITPNVYIAIPRPEKANTKMFRHITHIARKLDVGLMTVALDSPMQTVDILVFPEHGKNVNGKRTKSVLNEMKNRSRGVNTGGSTKTKINTAYREKCIKIACTLEVHGSMSAKDLVRNYGCDKNAYNLMYQNFYGWFERVDKGIYYITDKCRQELNDGGLKEIADYYRGIVHL